MAIFIENQQNKIAISDTINQLLNQAVEITLQQEAFSTPVELNILLVDNEGIREVNKEHRKIDKATDVLSFPILDIFEGEIKQSKGDFDLDGNLLIIGDIVISLEMVKMQAEEYGHSFSRELVFLATHGILHLLGYDHEILEDEKKMINKQEVILAQMGLTVI